MKKNFILSFYCKRIVYSSFCLVFIFTASSYGQLSGTAGAFSRVGFGARGMGMGNALTAVSNGELPGYYNSASPSVITHSSGALSFGILSLDRSLNTIYYAQPIDTTAGLAVGIINSGVTNIDGRDADGYHTENYSVSENQFSFSFSKRFNKLSLGITSKIYYYKLFKNLSSTAVGIDIGALYRITPRLTAGIVVKDLMAKYKWDTSSEELYGQNGNSTTERFPQLKIAGLSYLFGDHLGIISGEIEFSDNAVKILRSGIEIYLLDILTLRAGIDGWNMNDKTSAHPSFGFSILIPEISYKPAVHYAYVVEPYNVFAMHCISLSVSL
ncbi:MAG: hypothetical protein H3C35_02785 [Bacteroidetes bacterium]|nr:hypothetical protein [Bacteroidota bacterium]